MKKKKFVGEKLCVQKEERGINGVGVESLGKQLNDGSKKGRSCTQIENGFFFQGCTKHKKKDYHRSEHSSIFRTWVLIPGPEVWVREWQCTSKRNLMLSPGAVSDLSLLLLFPRTIIGFGLPYFWWAQVEEMGKGIAGGKWKMRKNFEPEMCSLWKKSLPCLHVGASSQMLSKSQKTLLNLCVVFLGSAMNS